MDYQGAMSAILEASRRSSLARKRHPANRPCQARSPKPSGRDHISTVRTHGLRRPRTLGAFKASRSRRTVPPVIAHADSARRRVALRSKRSQEYVALAREIEMATIGSPLVTRRTCPGYPASSGSLQRRRLKGRRAAQSDALQARRARVTPFTHPHARPQCGACPRRSAPVEPRTAPLTRSSLRCAPTRDRVEPQRRRTSSRRFSGYSVGSQSRPMSDDLTNGRSSTP